jgi:hypothetical protein
MFTAMVREASSDLKAFFWDAAAKSLTARRVEGWSLDDSGNAEALVLIESAGCLAKISAFRDFVGVGVALESAHGVIAAGITRIDSKDAAAAWLASVVQVGQQQ